MKFFIIELSLCLLIVFQGYQCSEYSATSDPPVRDANEEAFAALQNGDVESVEHLLSSVNVNDPDRYGYTLLLRAARKGDEKMVEMLLKHGADINKTDRQNAFTPFHLVNKNRGCDFSCEPKDQVVYDRIAEMLIKNGADVTLPDKHGQTALHDAAQYGFEKVAEMIVNISNGAIVNHKTYNGDTPLCFVAYYGTNSESQNKIADLLIKHGAVVNMLCRGNGRDDQRTPLHLAAYKNRGKIVELLLENGADSAVKDKDGKTALDLAKERNYDNSNQHAVDLLTQHEKQ
ncbi:poly [ADP-ribose] polymerase tankyrase-2-like [Bradysia coprophila]|uniref:poly [ADP-ribose] polymerase tankyrase-2-like n=1 Tax=Bradysia coprophila TaxID=38358 RepID=UPI00187D7491|nr:poly [ADP-ribose] polymerase tankyrase-2-like [Bradysia coprophila]